MASLILLVFDLDNLISAEGATFLQVRLYTRFSYNSRHCFDGRAVVTTVEPVLARVGQFAELDPKAFEPGKSMHKKMPPSKVGNRHIGSALYMPTLSAK
ncbi:hypothetical protein EBB_22350 [Methylomonas sp. EbB]|uniref:Uncharacterized protein n=1 Tax=Methylomonas fluvii TaxID=1854564 RepID=A0ABR9DLH2_9GAMM|nr:hypothetical protein [Methylomonas fluvii]